MVSSRAASRSVAANVAVLGGCEGAKERLINLALATAGARALPFTLIPRLGMTCAIYLQRLP